MIVILGLAHLIETVCIEFIKLKVDLSNVSGRWNLFTDKSAKSLLNSTPCLKYLNLSNCSLLTDKALVYVAHCTHLETLNLSECSRLSCSSPLHLCAPISKVWIYHCVLD